MSQRSRGEREADQAPAFLGHEVDRFGCDELPSHGEVALVLAILIIYYRHHPSSLDLLQGLFDRGERGLDSSCMASPRDQPLHVLRQRVGLQVDSSLPARRAPEIGPLAGSPGSERR